MLHVQSSSSVAAEVFPGARKSLKDLLFETDQAGLGHGKGLSALMGRTDGLSLEGAFASEDGLVN
jgi:hypothetical protein